MLTADTIEDISISTDGIFTFSPDSKKQPLEMKNPAAYLLVDTDYTDMPNMLLKKTSILEQHYGLKPSDDLGIIRIRR